MTAAVEFVELMERLEFTDFKVSMKSTSVPNTIASNRLLSERIPYPLHLGVTEAGTKWSGSLKSAVGLGTLLADGIGDTIRISLSTFHAEEEVKVAWEILKALKLRERGPVLIACPTCGRLQFDMDSVVAEIERRLEAYEDPIEVSVLGCAVNGIGEARHADFGITGAKDMGMIYSKGEPLKKVPTAQLVDELFAEIDRWYAAGKKVVRDERQAAEARAVAGRRGGRHADDARAPRRARGRRQRGRRRRRRGPGRRAGLADERAPVHARLMASALVVVDVQSDFTPGGALGVEGGDEIIAAHQRPRRVRRVRRRHRHPRLAPARPRLVRRAGRPLAAALRPGHPGGRASPRAGARGDRRRRRQGPRRGR